MCYKFCDWLSDDMAFDRRDWEMDFVTAGADNDMTGAGLDVLEVAY